MPYVKKLDKLESGPISWENSEEIPLSDIGNLLNKKTLAAEYANNDAAFIFTEPPATKTLTFTAPEDLTIKRLVLETVSYNLEGVSTDYSHSLGLERLRVVSGTGPDVGYDVFQGNSPMSMGIFSIKNIGFTPLINIRMAAGDVLEMDIIQGLFTGFTPSNLPISLYFTYEDEIDYYVSPKKFLGGQAAGDLFKVSVPSGGTAASATITVNSAPATSTIDFDQLYSNNGITGIISRNLTAGTGASGTDTYDNTIGTVLGLRNNLVSVINDPANQFSDFYTASNGGAGNQLIITQNDTGASGNYDVIDTDVNFSATAFTGGTSSSVGAFAFTPTQNIVITDLFFSVTTDVNLFGPIINPSLYYVNAFEILGIEVNGVGQGIGRALYYPMGTIIGLKKMNVAVNTGQTIEIFARAGNAREQHTVLYAIVAETV